MEYRVEHGGSGTGFHYWKGWLECPRKMQLLSTIPGSGSVSRALLVGTYTHAFLEIYYSGGLDRRGYDTRSVEFMQVSGEPWEPDEKARLEAERIFRGYRARFAPDGFGDVVGVERYLKVEGAENTNWLPPGVTLTGKIDLVVHMNKAQCERLKNERKLSLEPGYYIIDHKTAWGYNRDMITEYKHSLQFLTYGYLWNTCNPDMQVRGVLANILYKTTKPTFGLVFAWPNLDMENTERELILNNFYLQALIERAFAEDISVAKPLHCKWCPFFNTEDCRRY